MLICQIHHNWAERSRSFMTGFSDLIHIAPIRCDEDWLGFVLVLRKVRYLCTYGIISEVTGIVMEWAIYRYYVRLIDIILNLFHLPFILMSSHG